MVAVSYTHLESGLLIEGFDTPPCAMMPHGKPWYAAHIEQLGYHKGIDLLAWWMQRTDLTFSPALKKLMDQVRKKVTIRCINRQRFAEEMQILREIFNSGWQHNWGFVPVSYTHLELTAIRSMGFSIFRIALVALVAGILWTVSLGAIDEWVASPLQQQALQIKSTATALGEDDDITGNMLWARRGNEFVTVKSLNEQGQPVGVEIFHYRDDLSLESYIYARSATIEDDKTWILHGVNHKKWLNGKETLETLDNLAWQSAFTSMDLEELSMPGNTFSVRQLNHYIHYLQETGQPSSEYRLALWEKLGQPILTLAMILLAVPFRCV